MFLKYWFGPVIKFEKLVCLKLWDCISDPLSIELSIVWVRASILFYNFDNNCPYHRKLHSKNLFKIEPVQFEFEFIVYRNALQNECVLRQKKSTFNCMMLLLFTCFKHFKEVFEKMWYCWKTFWGKVEHFFNTK